jgi:hypothetical protein
MAVFGAAMLEVCAAMFVHLNIHASVSYTLLAGVELQYSLPKDMLWGQADV